MNVKLISADPCGEKHQRIVVARLPVVIGRSLEAGVRLDDRWVSRRHCELDEVDGTLVVRDLQSRHGTFVNGHGVSEARLLPGDKLTVGMTSLLAHYRREPAELPRLAHERLDRS
jgi:pSer/pThr/pTyr-binding forkhead associated (FHA) protein